ncbi:MAG: 4Fe-4S dicluster domain-containing protein [Longimicrobiales bacterium]
MNGLLVDVTRCTGCERCVAACVEANGLDPVEAQRDRATTADGLSANRLVSLVRVQDRFVRKSCMHCVEPACVAACLVGGITKTPEGPVVYDPDKCIGCRYCMLACPFHVPRYQWDRTTPFMAKCAFCFERLAEGRSPACVEACPEEALTFGTRSSLLEEAHRRIETHPHQYQPHVWGEHEFGGTSVLYVSDVDLNALGWPGEQVPSIPSLTQPLIEKTPAIGLSVAGCLLGVNWVIRRRMSLAGGGADPGPEEGPTRAPGEGTHEEGGTDA